MPLSLSARPRLFFTSEHAKRLRQTPGLPVLERAASANLAEARRLAKLPPLDYPRNVHNELLVRARAMQNRVLCLVTAFLRTGQTRFRDAVVRCVDEMGGWRYWSWLTMRAGDDRPDAIFDLSYGENCATLALAYDLLFHELTDGERKGFRDIAMHWGIEPGRVHCRPGGAWWFGKPDSNWNTVCAGGLGMLTLAMGEDVPRAGGLLKQVEASIKPFFRSLDATDGAWPEGIGYWNYGMSYGFMYLLSHEAATGRKHPLLRRKGVKKTVAFPLDFAPHGIGCSFGDVNRFRPLPIHYAMAQRLDRTDVCRAIDAILETAEPDNAWRPNAALWPALHPGTRMKSSQSTDRGVVRLYKGLDWAVLADRLPEPGFYLSLRGGDTNVPHSHLDLLSWHAVVGDEQLVINLSPTGYLDTTFSPRRNDLFEMRPESKNTILVNGVGIVPGAKLKPARKVAFPGGEGILFDASETYGEMRDGPGARFCGRLAVLLRKGKGILLLDAVDLFHPGRAEVRLHARADVRSTKTGAVLRGERASLRVAFASNVECVPATGATSPTDPAAPSATVLRWASKARTHRQMVFATLLTPGRASSRVALEAEGTGFRVACEGNGWNAMLRATARLRPRKRG